MVKIARSEAIYPKTIISVAYYRAGTAIFSGVSALFLAKEINHSVVHPYLD